jgi:hypothetical protein
LYDGDEETCIPWGRDGVAPNPPLVRLGWFELLEALDAAEGLPEQVDACDARVARVPRHPHDLHLVTTSHAIFLIILLGGTRDAIVARHVGHSRRAAMHAVQKRWPHGFNSIGSSNGSMQTTQVNSSLTSKNSNMSCNCCVDDGDDMTFFFYRNVWCNGGCAGDIHVKRRF